MNGEVIRHVRKHSIRVWIARRDRSVQTTLLGMIEDKVLSKKQNEYVDCEKRKQSYAWTTVNGLGDWISLISYKFGEVATGIVASMGDPDATQVSEEKLDKTSKRLRDEFWEIPSVAVPIALSCNSQGSATILFGGYSH